MAAQDYGPARQTRAAGAVCGLWLALVTPASFEVGRHLIEGLKNPTVVRDRTALEVFPIRPMGVREAVQKALAVDQD